MSEPLPEIHPENFWRDVFHADCPHRRNSPMLHLPARLVIEDGSRLRGFECTGCGAKVFAGLDASRIVTRRDYR